MPRTSLVQEERDHAMFLGQISIDRSGDTWLLSMRQWGWCCEEDSLFVVYREIMTVIAGSATAIRSDNGCLTELEYVHKSTVESRDSDIEGEAPRRRIYKAFEDRVDASDNSKSQNTS
eukprot:5841837-Amphidinium_carterae.1